TFERYFFKDKASHKEEKNPYYHLREDSAMCRKMLAEFDLDPDQGRIINGHTPVKEIDGEDPITANGKMIDRKSVEQGKSGRHVTGVQTCALPISHSNAISSRTKRRIRRKRTHTII